MMQLLVPIVTFDVIDPEYSTELILNFDKDNHQEFNEGMANLKYESNNALLNMGGLFWFMIVMAIKLVLIPITWFLAKLIAPCTNHHKTELIYEKLIKFKNSLMSSTIYSGLIALSY